MPQTPVQYPLRRAAHRWLRSAGAALAALLLITCSSDSPVGPGRPGIGSLRVAPVFDAFARVAPLSLDNVRVIVVRPPAETLAVVPRQFNPNSPQLQISIPVFLQSVSEDLLVTLELYSGTTLLFSGTRTLRVRQGSTTPPDSVPVAYQGPGSQVASLVITPRDTTLSFGAIFPYTVNAADAQAQPVAQYYVSWSTPGAPAGTSIDGSGRLTAPVQRDTFFVKVVTPNGIVDSTSVIVAAAPSALLKVGGDGQTGLAGSRLAQLLAVQVNGTDGLPVPGAAVTFAVATGGGSVDSATATADAQGVARSGAILGASLGAQTFTASAAGVPTVTFSATATGISPTPVLLAAGGNHSCEIRGTQTFCWGENLDGELGDGSNTDRSVPVPVSTGQTFTSVALGTVHSCALTAAGQAFCWGANFVGALGDGTSFSRSTPVAVTGGRTFVQLAAGDDFTCGLTATGQAFCWGSNSVGELGDGSFSDRTAPVAVSGGHSFTRITASGSHACALDATGAAFCWGLNTDGELGTGSVGGPQNAPTAVTGGILFRDISVGSRSSCALNTAGSGFCWGFNFGFQLTSPQPVAGGLTYTALDMGGNHVCGLSGTGWRCGGRNNFGQLGDGTTTDQQTPVLPAGGFSFTAIAGGDSHTCGRTSTGTLCWGLNGNGQLGDGTITDHITPGPTVGPAASVAISAGDGQTAAPDSVVPIPPAVIVLDALSNPVPGVDVVFAVASGGGSVTGGVVRTDAAGIATVGSWTLGATAGSNTLTATVGSGGVTGNPVTFSATGATPPPVRTWTGAISTDWSDPGNWSPAGVPGALDGVTIAPTTNQPALTASSVAGGVTIAGAGARLTIAGQTLTVGNLTTHTDGLLVMTNPADLVNVTGGGVFFQGGDETGLLSAGELRVAGSFTQQQQTSNFSFFASGTHRTVMTGASLQSIHFCCGLPGSVFQNLDISNSAGINIQNNGFGIFVNDTLISQVGSGPAPWLYMLGSPLFAKRLRVDKLLVDRGTLTLDEGGVPATQQFDNVTFQNYLTTQTQFAIVAPGGAAGPRTLTFNNLTFQPLTTGNTGRYLNVTAPSGTLIVDLPGASPAGGNGPAFTTTSGAVTVNWPAGPAPGTWTGAVDTAWFTAGNWSDGNVPTTTTDVTIPTGTLRAPTVSGALARARNVTVQPGAVLTLASSLQVNGSLDAAGTITGTVTGIDLVGSGTVRGNVTGTFFIMTVNGSYTLSGRLVTPGLTINGTLTLAGHTAVVGSSVGDDFQTANNGVLVMTSATDSLIVGGAGPSVTFIGGSTAGKLTAGVILMNSTGIAAFTQDRTFSDSSYAPSGTHKVVFANASTTLLSMDSPAVGSHFNILDISAQTAGISLSSAIQVNGLFISTPSSGSPAITGGSNRFQVGGGTQVTGLTLTNAPLIINGGSSFQFDNVLLQSMPTSASQISGSLPGFATPLVFNNLVFSTVPTTGFYVDLADSDGPSPLALVVNLVNPTPATPGGFAQGTNGAVINWPAAAPKTWTGALTGDWNTAGNWSPAGVPTAADDVTIPLVSTQPSLSGNGAARNLTVASGVVVLVNGFTIDLAGDLVSTAANPFAGGGILQLAGTARTVSGNLGSGIGLTVTGGYTLTGRTTAGNGVISGSGSLVIGGHTLALAGTLNTTGSGTLTMTNASDSVIVTGNATFGGGSEQGLLTAGVLALGARFAQVTGSSSASFEASGTHRTVLNALKPFVTFQGAGNTAGTSHFQELTWVGGDTLTLTTLSYVLGQMTVNAASTFNGQSFTQSIHVGGLANTGVLTFFNVQLWIETTAPVPTALNNLTFTVGGGITALFIRHPGLPAGGKLTIDQATFTFVPTLGAVYLDVDDANTGDGNLVVVDVTNSSPTSGAPFILTANGATVNWPFNPNLHTWTGAADNSWENPLNWTGGGGPGITGDAVIPAGPATPVLGSNHQINSLLVQAGATVDLNGRTLTMNNGVDASGSVTSGVAGGFVGTFFGPIRGNFANVSLEIGLGGSAAALNGSLSVTGAGNTVFISGDVTMAGSTIGNAQGIVKTFNGVGRLLMTNAADLVVADSMDFSGGDETGQLTAGVIQTRSLAQGVGGTSSTSSFFAGGNHKVVLGGSSASTISFRDAGSSRFQELDVTNVSPTLTLASNVTVAGQLTSLPSATPPTITGTGVTLTAGGADVTGLTVNTVPLVLSGGTITAFSNVTFTNQSPIATQLTVNNVGSGTPFTFGNLDFQVQPTAGGFYLVANDLDGPTPNPLTIDVVNSNPAAASRSFVQEINGAVINWPPSGGIITWAGTTSSDWSLASNWTGGVVPGIAENVVIPSGTPFAPVLTTNVVMNDLTITPGATIDVAAFGLGVNGTLDNGGTITTASNGILSLSGTGGKLLRGTVDADVAVTPSASYLLNGRFTLTAPHILALSGILELGGHTAEVTSLAVNSATGQLRMLTALDSMIVADIASFDGASTAGVLTAGVLTVGGDFIQLNTQSTESFQASGTHRTVFNGPGIGQSIGFLSPGTGVNSRFQDLQIATSGGSATFLTTSTTVSGSVTVANSSLSPGGFDLGGHTLTVGGSFSTAGAGTLFMLNASDSLLVSGDASFSGASTDGALPDGVLIIGGNFTQTAVTSTTSFAPSGTHMTVFNSATAQTIDFGSPGAGAGGSHFMNLDLSAATGGVSLTVNTIVDNGLNSSNAAAKLSGPGTSLTARIWNVSGLIVDNVPMILNENGLQSTHVFDNVTFQGFPTTANSVALIDVTADGTASGGRFIDFHGTQLQTTLGSGGLYVRAQSGNGLGYLLRMIGSNDPTGGFSRSQATPPASIQYQ